MKSITKHVAILITTVCLGLTSTMASAVVHKVKKVKTQCCPTKVVIVKKTAVRYHTHYSFVGCDWSFRHNSHYFCHEDCQRPSIARHFSTYGSCVNTCLNDAGYNLFLR